MYVIDFFKRLFKKSNIGTIIWLILNTLLLMALFGNPIIGLLCYLVSIAIALSPVGEWILRQQTGCGAVDDPAVRQRMEPIFQRVYSRAKQRSPELPDDITLYMNDDGSPNAFATGRKTMCFTRGLLILPDAEIEAILGHEFGHLAHGDTDVILVVAVGNLIVSAIFVISRWVFRICCIIAGTVSDSLGTLIGGMLIDLWLGGCMWLWTKLGSLLCLHSSRANEFNADAYSAQLGYAADLASALDHLSGGEAPRGLFASLSASHPATSSRIAALLKSGAQPAPVTGPAFPAPAKTAPAAVVSRPGRGAHTGGTVPTAAAVPQGGASRFCTHCGNAVYPEDNFCIKCGEKLR